MTIERPMFPDPTRRKSASSVLKIVAGRDFDPTEPEQSKRKRGRRANPVCIENLIRVLER